ncbi:MAG: hypothetical protein IKX34_04165 [Bacteroidales bacterium]|nr:hypothetical protein [Bacteroidales bacterium]
MKQIPFILAALLLTLAGGCSEQIIEKTPVVHMLFSGTVVNRTTGRPIEGLKVSLADGLAYSSLLPPYNPACPPAMTDGSGAYRLEYTGKPIIHAFLYFEDIDGPEHGGDFGSAMRPVWIDYSQTSMQASDDSWVFDTIEITVDISIP